MKKEYLILWIDDDLAKTETDRDDVSEYLASFGIHAVYDLKGELKAEENLLETLRESLDNKDLDLILVDFRMDGMDGRELIEAIRNTEHIFLPVIFYSTDGVSVLMDEARKHDLEGVYFANRDRENLTNKIKQVVGSLLAKEHTIKRTRGLLMEELSEIDAQFGVLANRLWVQLSSPKRAKIVKYLSEKLSDQQKLARSAFEKAPTEENEFQSFLSSEFMTGALTMMIRWKLLNKMLVETGMDAHLLSTFGELHQRLDSQTSLMATRNMYAHKTRASLEDQHSLEVCIEIRKEIWRHLLNIESIGKSLK